jgi:hypothetical protein
MPANVSNRPTDPPLAPCLLYVERQGQSFLLVRSPSCSGRSVPPLSSGARARGGPDTSHYSEHTKSLLALEWRLYLTTSITLAAHLESRAPTDFHLYIDTNAPTEAASSRRPHRQPRQATSLRATADVEGYP